MRQTIKNLISNLVLVISLMQVSCSSKDQKSELDVTHAVSDSNALFSDAIETDSPYNENSETGDMYITVSEAHQLYPILDSGQYFKLSIQTTFEEYEGQTEGWYAEWYFDKNFDPKYFRELHRYGNTINPYGANGYFERAFSLEYYNDVSDDNTKYNADRPDVEEFLIKNDSVIYVRKDCNFISDNRDFGRTITIWANLQGGVKNSWSYDSVIFLKEQVSENFGLEKNNEWKKHVDDLLTVIREGTVTYQEGHITVELIEPRDPDDPSSLVNSWNIILSPVLYDHLYDMKK